MPKAKNTNSKSEAVQRPRSQAKNELTLPKGQDHLFALQMACGNQATLQMLKGAGCCASCGSSTSNCDDRENKLSDEVQSNRSDHLPSEGSAELPAGLRNGLEHLSRFDLSTVQVHYNSPEPARIGAHAFAQGQNIHIAPNQERHLPHEAWHTVQQMQGRVQPTTQMKGVSINSDDELEREADVMGAKALRIAKSEPAMESTRINSKSTQESGTSKKKEGIKSHLTATTVPVTSRAEAPSLGSPAVQLKTTKPPIQKGPRQEQVVQREPKKKPTNDTSNNNDTNDESTPTEEDPFDRRIQFKFKVDRDLPAAAKGELQSEQMIWAAQQVYRIPRNKARDIVYRNGWQWLSDISATKPGEEMSFTWPIHMWISGLMDIHGFGSEIVQTVLDESFWEQDPKVIERKLTPAFVKKLAEIAKIQETISPTDLKFFKLWAKKAGIRVINLADATPEQLALYKKSLKQFVDNKYQLLQRTGLLDEFVEEEDPEAHYEFQQLKDKIFKVDKKLIKEFTEITGVSIMDLLVAMPLRQVVANQRLIRLEKELGKVGVSLTDFAQLLLMFRNKALKKTIRLLAQSEKISDEESARYRKQSEIDELLKFIVGDVAARFSEADELRADAVFKFFKEKPRRHPYWSDDNDVDMDDILFSGLQMAFKANDKAKMIQTLSKYRPDAAEKLIAKYIYRRDNPSKYPNIDLEGAEINIYANIKEAQAAVAEKYPEFQKAREKDAQTRGEMGTVDAKQFPVLADIHTNWRQLSRKKKPYIISEIRKMLIQKKQDAVATRRKLLGDPDLIWELQPVVMMTLHDLQIDKSGKVGSIIWDKVEDVESSNLVRSLGLGALGIVLGILGFFTGGATWAGAAVIAGGLAVSAVDLYFEAKSYSFHSAAAEAAFGVSLTVNPGAFGVAMAIFGLLIDAVDVVKAAAKLVKISSESISAAKSIDEVEELAGKSFEELKQQGLLKESVTKAEFIAKVSETAKAEAKIAKGYPSAFDSIVGSVKLNRRDKFGLFRIFDTDPNTCEAIVKALASDPDALRRVARHALSDPTITGSFFPHSPNPWQRGRRCLSLFWHRGCGRH